MGFWFCLFWFCLWCSSTGDHLHLLTEGEQILQTTSGRRITWVYFITCRWSRSADHQLTGAQLLLPWKQQAEPSWLCVCVCVFSPSLCWWPFPQWSYWACSDGGPLSLEHLEQTECIMGVFCSRPCWLHSGCRGDQQLTSCDQNSCYYSKQ